MLDIVPAAAAGEGDPPPPLRLPGLRGGGGAGARAGAADHRRDGDRGPARARAGGQVRRFPALVPPGRDLRPARDRPRPLHAVRLGRAGPAGGWSRCGACCAGTSWPRPGSSPTTPRCRCSTPAGAGPRPAGCGATRSTTGPGAAAPRRRWSTSTPRTARASIRPPTWPGSGASCRSTATAGSSACSRTGRPGRSGSPSAGPTAGGDSTRSTRPPARRWPRRRCAGSASSTRSRRRSAAARPRSGGRPGRSAAGRSSRPCTPGSPPSWGGSRASPAWRRRSATPCATGRGWCCSSRTAGSSSTPTPSSGRSGRSPWHVHSAPLLQGSGNIGIWFAEPTRCGRPLRTSAAATRWSARSTARIW